MGTSELCFPEPEAADPTPATRAETTGKWLRRSTWSRARQCRSFYNQNLAALPPGARADLCARLRRDRSQAAHFELVVGRFLQLLGASDLQHEVVGAEGLTVDWVAAFDDGLVAVEATAPVVNAVIGATAKAGGPITDLAAALAPAGWHVIVVHAPPLARGEPRHWVKRRLAEWLEGLPPAQPGLHRTFLLQLTNGLLHLDYLGASDPTMRPEAVSGPMVGYIDDTSEVVHRAVAGKRRQARGSPQPVLAAIYTAGFGGLEIEKFDIALFGRSVAHMGSSRVTLDPSGVFGRGSGAPTFAGALAFADLGWGGGPDPVLYLHPRYTGHLPAPLLRLRRRSLTPDGIVDAPADSRALLPELRWPTGE